jgi:hypothetical protein
LPQAKSVSGENTLVNFYRASGTRKKIFITLTEGGIFLVENFNPEMLNAEGLTKQAEMRKQQEQIESAILSLKTNLSIFLILILLVVSGVFLSSDVISLIFSVLKNLAPVVTSFINFKKIRSVWSRF